MSGVRYEVHYSEQARIDLLRLREFLLDRADTLEALDDAEAASDALESAIELRLSTAPFICRKIGKSPTRRELLIPFRRGGYVVLFEVESATKVLVLAARHQLESDYH